LISSALLASIAAVVVVQASTGWPMDVAPSVSGVADPTLEALDWRGLRNAPGLDPRPAFVISTKWSDAGKIALALGPDVPVFVISGDPRGWTYAKGGQTLLGRDGVLIARAADLQAALSASAPCFQTLGEPQFSTLTRHGRREIELALVPVKGLTQELPLTYPGPSHR
jgi:hypothetical protein